MLIQIAVASTAVKEIEKALEKLIGTAPAMWSKAVREPVLFYLGDMRYPESKKFLGNPVAKVLIKQLLALEFKEAIKPGPDSEYEFKKHLLTEWNVSMLLFSFLQKSNII